MKQLVSFVLPFLLLFAVASPVYASDTDIVINEFQVEPSGASQWVELYNKGNESVTITSWVIDDSGGSESFTIPSVTLASHQCVSFQSSGFNLNTTTSDSVRLFKDNNLIDSKSYEKSPGVNASFGRAPDGEGTWISFIVPTRDSLNADGSACLVSLPTATPTVTTSPTPSKSLTPTKSPTATNSPTPKNTPTPTKIPTATTVKTPTPTPKKTSTTQVQGSSTVSTPTPDYDMPTAVLAARDEQAAWPTIAPSPTKAETKILGANTINPGVMMIGFGVSVILFSSGLLYYNHKKSQGSF